MTVINSNITNYEQAIANLPTEALLGSLLWYSISAADVNLDDARAELTGLGLRTDCLRKLLRPVDAFAKTARDIGKKFKEVDEVRSEFLVRRLGETAEEAHQQVVLERVLFKGGQRKGRLLYEPVADLRFTRGTKTNGTYTGFGVEAIRTTANLPTPLTDEEDGWLTGRLDEFGGRFDHLLHYMDSHGVRSFVRDYLSLLGGTCVKESGGVYFVSQDHAEELAKLGHWVKSIGSDWHSVPLLNLADQRAMILEALEEETVAEVERMMTEISKILSDPGRSIEEKTFDAYGMRAAELSKKVNEYTDMLGERSDRAGVQIQLFSRQVLQLANRIKQPGTGRARLAG